MKQKGKGRAADHPRIRGEHEFNLARDAELLGSSPHTRGALSVPHGSKPRIRIIPAYAGSTPTAPSTRWTCTDHPRIRGEHVSPPNGDSKKRGSSPHTRGALVTGHVLRLALRIIPAYAGSTVSVLPGPGATPDHPRIRGEHVTVFALNQVAAGSSPHTRGAPIAQAYLQCAGRIIPAYAGSTTSVTPTLIGPWDHPRIRGEHLLDGRGKPRNEGSSPHTRGALHSRARRVQEHGIIPAYAGSTSGHTCPGRDGSDHPRIRGEHGEEGANVRVVVGSSPHTRGARSVHDAGGGRPGIIPAYAGSTPCRGCRAVCTGDHPRIRGEHLVDPLPSGHDGGSSPHTRGARLVGEAWKDTGGIIPAYAGSTS